MIAAINAGGDLYILVAAIQMAKNNRISIVPFHPHASNKMQLLDVGVFSPFQTFYNRAMKNSMCKSGNVAKPDIPELVNHALMLVFTNILAGFHATGIDSLNSDILTDITFCSEM